jgi:phospholipase/carboxylesterase
MTTPLQPLQCHRIDSLEPAVATVIWLHGLGASAHDFDSIIPYLHAKPSLRGVRFIFPQAPMRAVTLNQGYVMPAWYDIYQVDKHGRQDQEGIEQSCASLMQTIEAEINKGMPADKIFLIGYSQGGAMALYASLMGSQILAGVIGLSTYLPLIDLIQTRVVNHHNAYWMAHGTRDAVVPFMYGQESVLALRAQGCAVDFHSYPIGHEISMPEIEAMSDWMAQRLNG